LNCSLDYRISGCRIILISTYFCYCATGRHTHTLRGETREGMSGMSACSCHKKHSKAEKLFAHKWQPEVLCGSRAYSARTHTGALTHAHTSISLCTHTHTHALAGRRRRTRTCRDMLKGGN